MRHRLTMAAAVVALAAVLAAAGLSMRSADPAHALTPTPSWTSTPIPPNARSLVLDCDSVMGGIQSNCAYAPGTTTIAVDIVIENNGPAFQLGAFGTNVDNLDLSRLVASTPLCPGSGLDCNPDFNQVHITGVGWACGPPNPSPDIDPGTPGQQSFFSCFNGAADGPTIPAGSSLRVGTITYDVAPGALAGSVPLTLRDASVYDEGFSEMMSCNPTITTPGPCSGASLTIAGGPTITTTVTPTATGTPGTPPTAAPTQPPATAVASQNLNPTPAGRFFAIDCDLATAGVQDDCTYTTDAGLIDVGFVFVNNGPPVNTVCCFNFELENPDTSRLEPPAIPNPYPALDSNPDANQAALSPTFQCTPPPPDNDTGANGLGTSVSFLSCFDGSPLGPPVASGQAVLLARVHYNVPGAAQPGTVPLTLNFVAAFDETFSEIGSCEPPVTEPAVCVPASITLIGAGPGVEKVPDGNENNADLIIPAANLWICEAPAACAGPGEGDLRVIERASDVHSDTDGDNIPDGSDPCVCTGLGPDNTIGTPDDTNPVAPPFTDLGLGAYEFSVEYDNFVIQSVNPCDIVFGTGSPPGAGANRGPVDELDTSAINPDCFGDAGPAAPGSCAMSLILENIIHFGCATGGTNLGPTGDMDLASLLLIPHPDLNNDLFPGNNNGVLTVLKDNGCELVDTLGHPVNGSVNGGLTPYCRDLAVTVRILEGDLDLDCDVDLTDAQAIASRYGAFFGGLLYSKWYDLEPQFHDLDIDIKDVQKVFGRQDSTCFEPIPAQPPLGPPTAFQD